MSERLDPAAPVGVVGGGAWGTALAQAVASDGTAVRLWALETEVVDAINREQQNPLYLPGVALHRSITADTSLALLADCPVVLVVTPAQHSRSIIASLPRTGQTLLLCSKGMEQATGKLMAEVAAESGHGGPVAVLSGPTFAHEVAAGLPAAVTIAAEEAQLAEALARHLARPRFRPYASTDVTGAEIGGVVKNVLAIACGVVEGAGLGQNARAALIARGFAEMVRYGLARGAQLETLTGLAGLGDLVLTCSSSSSRNFSLGHGLGEGKPVADLLAERRTVAEGAFSAAILVADARGRGVDMPICDAVARLVSGDAAASAVIGELLARPLNREGWARLG
jgi:glycerol-3-phosphate dehydrogenase (NAD(P)+)